MQCSLIPNASSPLNACVLDREKEDRWEFLKKRTRAAAAVLRVWEAAGAFPVSQVDGGVRVV